VVYKPLRAASIYGSVASSATPPGNALSQGQDGSSITSISNQALPPEKTRSEEVGVKWEVGPAKALVTVAWFQQDTQNVRITQSDGSITGTGARRNRGLDTGISGYLTSKWQVFGGYTFMNAILQNTGVTNVTLNGVTTPVLGLLDGRRFPNTPQNSFTFTSYYQVNRKLSVGGGVYATGKVYGADNPATPFSSKWVPGYGRVDIFSSYAFNKHFNLQGNLQNVGDKAYFLQAFTTHYAQLGPGRQGRMTLNYTF
jgi:catecholate siderophore receptor